MIKNERFCVGYYNKRFGLWHNFSDYEPLMSFTILNTFTYTKNTPMKYNFFVTSERETLNQLGIYEEF